MRKNIDLSAEEYSEIVDSFYTYFENTQGRYVGGISKAYRDFGLRQPDGVFVSKRAVWHIDSDTKFTVEFKIHILEYVH